MKKNVNKFLCNFVKGRFKTLLIMKMTFLFSFLFLFVIQAKVLPQDKKISIEATNSTVREILHQVEESSDYRFFYNDKLTDLNKPINFKIINKSELETLQSLFKELSLTFQVLDNNLVLIVPKVNSQEILIKGTVTDASGNPLPGVNVLEKGTINGTVTNLDGDYSISVSSKDAILSFSYVGYLTEDFQVGDQTTINFTLIEDIQSLEEVIVIGYGTQKKRDLTGSVASVREEVLKSMSVTSIDQTLQGLASGVVVQQQSGQPGGATSIRIRGGNSINAGSEPLYVIDGFPIYNENTSASSGILSGIPSENALSTINPSDIVSIEILKDASATAIYGSRAANGVILITTKRGKQGTSNIDFEAYYGIQEAARTYDLLNAYEYAIFRNDVYKSTQSSVTYTDEQIEEFKKTGGTDWQDEMLRIAPVQNYQLSVSGGSEKMQYAISGNYYNQEGIIINSYLKRFSFRSNLDVQANKWIKFGESLTASRSFSNQIPSGGGADGTVTQTPSNIWSSALFMNPCLPVYDEDGEYIYDNTYEVGEAEGANNSNVAYNNPVAYAKLVDSKNISTRVIGNIYSEFEFIEGLRLKILGGTNIIYNKQNLYVPSTIRDGDRAPDGKASIGTIQNIEYLNENTLTYDKEFNDIHHLTLLAGATYQTFESEGFYGSSVEFATDELSYNNIQSGNLSGDYYPSIASDKNEWTIMSGIFRGFYSLKEKYLFTITGRYDGSSKFGANNKWAFFPSAAFGWRISEEEFLKNTKIHNLKLRLSWGKSGNQNIPTYQSLSSLTNGSYAIGGSLQTGFIPEKIGNPDLKWETTAQTNIGVDLGLFNSRLNLTFDAYYKKTTDLLFDVPVPYESGFSSAYKNIGSLENKGIEIAVQSAILTGELKWDISANWALNRNKILELQGEDEIAIDPDLNLLKTQNSLLLKVGEPIGNFYGYVNDGIWQSQEEIDAENMQTTWNPGQRRFVDQNNDGLISSEDRVIIGNALPSFTGGITNRFSYKDFDFSFYIDYSYGNEVANLTQIEFEFLNGRQNGNKEVLNRWQPDDITLDRNLWTNSTNPDTDVQAVGYDSYTRQLHSGRIEDGSFIKLRTVTLGYTLPLNKLRQDLFKNARVYFSARNLLTLTKYTGLDPEASIFQNDNVKLGLDYAVYPTMKSYTFGINISF